MKKRNVQYIGCFILGIIIIITLANCGQDEGTLYLDAPEALATYDSSSGGVYKGAIAGSIGIFKIWMENGDDNIYAYLLLDDDEADLTLQSISPSNWEPGMACDPAIFTGVIGGSDVTLSFSVEAGGSNPQVSCDIEGHPTIIAAVDKETSDNQILAYMGRAWFENDTSAIAATWSLTIGKSTYEVEGVGIDGDSEMMWFEGEVEVESGQDITQGTIVGTGEYNPFDGPVLVFTGLFSGSSMESISGNWQHIEAGGNSGHWESTRGSFYDK